MPAQGGRAAARLDLLVVGHTNVDRFLDVSELPAADRTVPLLAAHESLGGTAATIAISAAKYGVRSGLVSLVGDDFPSTFQAHLRSARVDTTGVTTVRGSRTPACWILEDGRGSQMTVIDQGAMGDASRASVPRRLLSESSWVHLATGDPAFQLRVLDAARKLGRPVSADPAQEVHYRWSSSDLGRLLEGSEILFGNDAEVRAITKKLGVRRAEDLLDWVPLVVITLGPDGARGLTREGPRRASAGPRVATTHVTGAGDAFRGGFYAGWFSGQALEACLTAGTRAARAWLNEGAARPKYRAGSGSSR